MIVKKDDFLNLIEIVDNIEKRDFAKLDLTDIFDNLDPNKMGKIKNDFKGLENLKIIRLLYDLKNVRDKYDINIK